MHIVVQPSIEGISNKKKKNASQGDAVQVTHGT